MKENRAKVCCAGTTRIRTTGVQKAFDSLHRNPEKPIKGIA